MYNKAFLIGRLVKDPETRVTVSGINVTRFTIAIDRLKRKDEAESQTDFINVVAWRRQAEIAGQYLKKGKLVAIEGSMRVDNYEKDGEQRQWIEVVVDNFQMLDRLSDTIKEEEFTT